MIRLAISLVMLVLLATSCADDADKAQGPPKDVPKSALEGLLLSPDEINAVMGTDGMVAHPGHRDERSPQSVAESELPRRLAGERVRDLRGSLDCHAPGAAARSGQR